MLKRSSVGSVVVVALLLAGCSSGSSSSDGGGSVATSEESAAAAAEETEAAPVEPEVSPLDANAWCQQLWDATGLTALAGQEPAGTASDTPSGGPTVLCITGTEYTSVTDFSDADAAATAISSEAAYNSPKYTYEDFAVTDGSGRLYYPNGEDAARGSFVGVRGARLLNFALYDTDDSAGADARRALLQALYDASSTMPLPAEAYVPTGG